MPQQFHNTVTVKGPAEKITHFVKTCFTKGSLDFNKIIPMPEELDIPAGSHYKLGIYYINAKAGNTLDLLAFLDNPLFKMLHVHTVDDYFSYIERECKHQQKLGLPTAIELGEKALFNFNKYGYYTWLEWRCDKWGTKWNATEYKDGTVLSEDYRQIEFLTVWYPPVPIYQALNEMFPELEFSCTGSEKEGEEPTFAMLLTGKDYHG